MMDYYVAAAASGGRGMIYLNNSATSYPKPDRVKEACARYLNKVPSGQYRSAFEPNGEHSDILLETRQRLARFWGAPDTGTVYFSSGATESLNTVIRGLYDEGMHFVSTETEHNSVLRPLANLCKPDDYTLVSCDGEGFIDPEDVRRAITRRTRALIVNHASNVTGAVQDLTVLGAIAREAGILFAVDASQSSGSVPIDIERDCIDILVFTGHKGLLGIPGTGGFYLRNSVFLRPLKYGGTGKESKMLFYEEGRADYEPGTQNLPGIAALNEGLLFLEEKGLSVVYEKEIRQRLYLWDGLEELPGVRLFGSREKQSAPVVSFCMDGLDPMDLAYILSGTYGIIGRAGFHCAPEIHRNLGTYRCGTMRISLSWFTTDADIEACLEAVREIRVQLGEPRFR